MPCCGLEELLMAISMVRFGTSVITAEQTRTLVHNIIPGSLEGYT